MNVRGILNARGSVSQSPEGGIPHPVSMEGIPHPVSTGGTSIQSQQGVHHPVPIGAPYPVLVGGTLWYPYWPDGVANCWPDGDPPSTG